MKLPSIQFATLLFVSKMLAQAPDLDSFLTPADNNPAKGIVAPTKPAQEVKVTTEKVTSEGKETPVVNAQNMQDAVVAGASELSKGVRQVGEPMVVLKTASGIGYMVEGTARYTVYPENRNATLLSKRTAYTSAYMKAKSAMAKKLYGLNNKSKQDLDTAIQSYDTGKGDQLGNTSILSQETIEQKVEGIIRGSVIYAVNDNTSDRQVTVQLVTTPKTRGETMQMSQGFLMAKSARDGFGAALKEIKSGVLPPAGGKVIVVPTPDGGEQFYFLAFGSEIIRTNKDPDVAAQFKEQAYEVAESRAINNLVGLIIGDQFAWTRGISSKTEEVNKQFEEVLKQDPVTKASTIERIPLSEAIKTFTDSSKKTDAFSSAQNGNLPPGTNTVKWISEDGDWVYVAEIYNHALSVDAAKVGQAMRDGPSILEKARQLGQSAGGAGAEAPGSQSGQGAGNTDKKKPVGRGASGKVSENEKL